MIAQPPHNRKLGLCGVSLTKAKVHKQSAQAADLVRDAVEDLMIEAGYLDGAPFSWVTVAIRYGLTNDEEPSYQAINKTYGDLPLSIEVDTHEFIDASLDQLKVIFGKAVLKALIHAGRKYERPTGALEIMLSTLPDSLPQKA
jgi:hypothetical protein